MAGDEKRARRVELAARRWWVLHVSADCEAQPSSAALEALMPAAVEVTGAAVEVTGAAVEVTGAAVEVTGAAVEVTGAAVEVTGAAVEVTHPAATGMHAQAGGAYWVGWRGALFPIHVQSAPMGHNPLYKYPHAVRPTTAKTHLFTP